MALITEDGSGKLDAESYVSVTEFRDYCSSVGRDLAGADDIKIEQALRRGTRWIDATYGQRFIGAPAKAEQALEWPRTGAAWRGSFLPSNEIPRKVKNAACEAAWRELTTPGSLSPDKKRGGKIKEVGAGSARVVFADDAPSDTAFSSIDGLLVGFISKAGLSGSVDLLRV